MWELIPQKHFNPRSSCEERPDIRVISQLFVYFNPRSCWTRSLYLSGFQSTLLMRGATAAPHPRGRRRRISIHAPHARSDMIAVFAFLVDIISIHAPHARSDSPSSMCNSTSTGFQSTLLMRGATTTREETILCLTYFNPRSSCEERQGYHRTSSRRLLHFNPRSSCEERLRCSTQSGCRDDFNPRSSCEERPVS